MAMALRLSDLFLMPVSISLLEKKGLDESDNDGFRHFFVTPLMNSLPF